MIPIRQSICWIAATLLLLVAGADVLSTQSVFIYSTIVGTVTDSSGALVADARVTATNNHAEI